MFSFFKKKSNKENLSQIENHELKELNPIESIEVVREDDDFDNTYQIYLSNIGSKDFDYLPMYYDFIDTGEEKITSFKHLGIGFKISDDLLYFITYLVGQRDFEFNNGSKLHLVFENKKDLIINYELDSIGDSLTKINLTQIKPEELKYFTDLKLDKWKYTDSSNFYIAGDNTLFENSKSTIKKKETLQETLKHMAQTIVKEYLKLLK